VAWADIHAGSAARAFFRVDSSAQDATSRRDGLQFLKAPLDALYLRTHALRLLPQALDLLLARCNRPTIDGWRRAVRGKGLRPHRQGVRAAAVVPVPLTDGRSS